MSMDVAADDIFTTELRRVQYRKEVEEEDISFLKGKVLKHWGFSADDRPVYQMSRSQARHAIRLAQELGVLGFGLSEDATGKGRSVHRSETYLPELLELTWPPEGRIIERDCTCDLWDRIRCKLLFYFALVLYLLLFADTLPIQNTPPFI